MRVVVRLIASLIGAWLILSVGVPLMALVPEKVSVKEDFGPWANR